MKLVDQIVTRIVVPFVDHIKEAGQTKTSILHK